MADSSIFSRSPLGGRSTKVYDIAITPGGNAPLNEIYRIMTAAVSFTISRCLDDNATLV